MGEICIEQEITAHTFFIQPCTVIAQQYMFFSILFLGVRGWEFGTISFLTTWCKNRLR